MARYCRFRSRFSLLRTVFFLTGCSLGLSQAVFAQSVKSVANQSLQTVASGGPASPAPATPKSNALPTFLVAPSVTVSGAPSSVAVGDLNGDGKLDLVVADFDADKISVLLGQGNGKFATPVDYPVGKQPAFVLVRDVNGDGRLDVVACNEGDGTISVLLGNGDGTLQKPVTYQTARDPVYVAMADLNGDGKPDLAVAGNASKTIAVLLNDGTGKFSKTVPFNIEHAPQSLAVADFDGDGHFDLASANSDGTVSILLGRGDGSFRAISSLNVASVPLSSVVSGDFNGDGRPDLAVTGTKLLTVLLGKGDGTFQTGTSYTVGSNPVFAAVVDVNNDNVPDLVTANQSGNTFSVLLGNGDGTFKPSLDFTAGNSPLALASGDFNGDGRADLAIVNFSDHTVSVPLGNGDGTFQAARAYNVDLDRKSVAAGDLDGDGKPDLVVTNFCGTDAACAGNGTVSVLLAVGDGTYKLAASYPLGAGPLSVALADVNGDKKLDLIAVNRGDKSISVLLGNGDGTFQAALTYPAGNSPVSVAVGDFNKDGKPDLAIAGDCGSATCSQPGEVSVLLGNGDGSFQAAATYAVGYSPSSIFAGDVNGDDNLDLVVTNACGKDSSCQSNGTATVLLGDGKGGFTSGGDVQLGNNPSAVALGDLNGDGALDMVATYRSDNKVGVLLGNGDGTFKPQVTYPVGTAPSAVVVADFNGDGKRDVAVANFKDSNVSVLFGNGDGTLQTAVDYPVGVGPESLIAIDPNKSGHADLVTANGNGGLTPQGSNVTVLRNLSPGRPQPVFTNLTPSQAITYGTASINLSGTICVPFPLLCPPKGDTVTITIDNIPQNTTIDDNTGDFSTSYPTSTIPASSTPYTIDYNFPAQSGFNMADDQSTQLTVNPATPVFSNLMTTPSTITYGTASVTVSGTICAPGPVCPPQGEQVTITIQGQPPVTATISDNSGDFSTSYPTNTIPASNTPYPVTYGYNSNGSDTNFTSATGTGQPLTVNQAATTTVVTAVPPSPSSYNQDIQFTATVTGANGGSPTGTVDFTADGTPIANCTGLPLMSLKNSTGKASGGGGKRQPQGNGSAATCDVPMGLPVGQHTIQATYNGDSNYQGSSGTLPYQVNMAATTTVVTAEPPSPSSYNQDIQFTATVTGAFGGSPTGTVDFTADGAPIANCTGLPLMSLKNGTGKTNSGGGRSQPQDNGSAATCDVPMGLPVGQHTIQATYNGDSNYQGSSGTLMYQVNMAATTTVVTAVPPSPSSYLEDIQFTATVTGAFGGSPTGTVDFTADGTPIANCTGLPLMSLKNSTAGKGRSTGKSQPQGGSAATCDVPMGLPVGSHTIQATYNGDSNYQGSSGTLMYQVNMAATTTVVTAVPPSPSSYNQDIQFTATVTGAFGGSPTGTVDFTADGTPIANCTGLPLMSLKSGTGKANSRGGKSQPQGNGSAATCDVPMGLAAGQHTIQATYSGDSNYQGSSGTLPYQVNMATTTTTISDVEPPSPSSYGTQLTFTMTVTGANGGSPTGTVTIQDVTSGTPVTVCTGTLQPDSKRLKRSPQGNGSTATCMTDPNNPLMAGVHSIQAMYNGDSNFQASTSTPPISYTIGKATPTVAVSSDNNPSIYGQTVNLTATVTGVSGGTVPGGAVTFTDNGFAIAACSSVPVTKGSSNSAAVCTISAQNQNLLGAGTHTIVANYSDDNDYGPAKSANFTQTVNQAKPSTSVSNPVNPSISGQQVTFTSTVTPPYGGSPTGTVTFTSNGTNIPDCTNPAPLVNQVASCTTTQLASGQDSIQAIYSGDSNFIPTSSQLTQIVQDFSVAVSPGAVNVIQTYTNTNQATFSGYQQTITMTAAPTPGTGFAGTLNLLCTVMPQFSQQPQSVPTCTLTPTSLTGGGGQTTALVSTASSTTIGNYTVMVTSTYNYGNNGMLVHSTSLVLTVVNNATAIAVVPTGGPSNTTGTSAGVEFVASMSGTTVVFSCDSVYYTDKNGPHVVTPAQANIACTFNPQSATLSTDPTNPTKVDVTIQVSVITSAELVVPAKVLAMVWLGMPAIVLIGSLRGRKISRKAIVQILGMLLIVVALLQGIGCGGGFTPPQPSPNQTPTGFYQVLVVGTTTVGGPVQTSAVVPLTVGH